MNRSGLGAGRRYGLAMLAGVVAIGLSACGNLLGPRDVTFSQERVQAELNKRFPQNRRFAELFDLTLSQPRLTLIPEHNRVQFDLDIVIAPPFTSKRWGASVAVSGGLRVDAANKALMLDDARVEKMMVNGMDKVSERQFSKLGNFVAERIFQEKPVMHFKDEDLRVAGVQFSATAVRVDAKGLVLSVSPSK